MQYSGNIENDVLELNQIDEIDWEFMSYVDLEWKPTNVDALDNILKSDCPLVVISDCDADGLSSAGIAMWYLQMSNKNVALVVLERSDRNPEAVIQNCLSKEQRVQFLLLDCGTNLDLSNIYTQRAEDIVVIDHHEPKQEPVGYTVINPKLYNESEETTLSGAGLTYVCFSFLCGQSVQAIQYAMIGTVADVVPMISRNRWLVGQGLQACNTVPLALAQIFKKKFGKDLTETDIAFYIAPAINAASRMNELDVAVVGYVQNDVKKASELVEINTRRKKITDEIYRDAKVTVHPKCVVIEIDDGSQHAIASLVGNKVFGALQRPTISLIERENDYTISLRSGTTMNAAEFLFALKLESSGGHYGAAGGVVAKERKQEVIDRFIEYCNEWAIIEQLYDADIGLPAGAISVVAQDLEQLAPFGNGFRKPTFLTRMKMIYSFRFPPNGNHLKCKFVSYGGDYVFEAVIYNHPEDVQRGKIFDIVYELGYNKNHDVELVVRKIKQNE